MEHFLLQSFLVCCLLTVLGLGSSPLYSETFQNPFRIPTNGDPVGIHVVDVNNDGLPDLVFGLPTTLTNPAVISVLLGQPGGSYIALTPIVLPAFTNPSCNVADVNGDHKIDVICTNTTTSEASIVTFFGNGDGTFQAPITSPILNVTNQSATNFNIAAIADVNNDGHPDLIANGPLNLSTTILLGDGAGNFTLKFQSPGYTYFSRPSIADVNGDGKLDIINGSGPDVLLGNGDGTFTWLTGPTMNPAFENCIVQKDLDGDGHLDAVCQQAAPNWERFSVLHGNADGTFNLTNPVSTTTVANPADYINPLEVLDLNGDGIPDVVSFSEEGLMVFLGKPGVQFAAPTPYLTGVIDSSRFEFADLNKDGHPDVLTGGPNGIYVCWGRADGSFDSIVPFTSGLSVMRAAVADFNNDGNPDVITNGDQSLNLSLGKGDGTFAAAVAIPNGGLYFGSGPTPVIHGDFNGDGNQDVIAYVASGTTDILYGHGDGTFASPVTIPHYAGPSTSTLVADLNQDGRDDLIDIDSANLYVRLSQAGGGFAPSLPSAVPQEIYSTPVYTLGDFDHDGKIDAVVGLKNIYFLHGNGDGTFAAAGPAIPVPQTTGSVTSITTGDFDGDGKLDVAVLETVLQLEENPQSPPNSFVFIYYGNGDGTFSAPVALGPYNRNYTTLSAADLNHDGLSDLVLSFDNALPPVYYYTGVYAVTVVNGTPNRMFASLGDIYVSGGRDTTTAIADFNHDGFPDLLFANGDSVANTFVVLLNQPTPTVTGTLSAMPEPSVVGQAFTVTAAFAPPAGSSETLLSGPVTFSIDGLTEGSAALANNMASVSVPGTLAKGTHQLMASWGGDTNFPAVELSATHTVTGLPVTLTLASSLNPANLGQAVSLTAGLSTQGGAAVQPTGTITFTDNGAPLGSTLTVGGSGSFSWTLLNGFSNAGQNTIVATYSGDANYGSATATLVENVNPVATASVLQGSPNPSVYGQAVTFTTAVTANLNDPVVNQFGSAATVTLTGLPGGSVTSGVVVGGTTASTTTGVATYTTSALPAGTYTVSAAYSGSTNTLGSVAGSVVQVVQRAPTTTTLSVNPATAYQTQAVTFSAHVAGVGTPGGTVQFLDGGVGLATVQLSAGAATFATAQLGVGTHTITAVYSGDANDAGSASMAVVVTIQPSDFALSLDSPSVSLVTGHHTTLHLTASSVGVFAGSVHLSVSTLPQWVTFTFTPTDVQVPQGGSAKSAIYLDTDAVIGYLSQRRSGEGMDGGASAAVAIALVLVPVAVRRRRALASMLGLAIAMLLLAGATGCSGKYPDSTPPGTYNLQVTGTSGSLTHSVTLTLTVQ